jgi:hypothetical protein
MTRNEAIAILIREIDDDPFMRTEYREQIHEAFDMVIQALEQSSCEDAISRQSVLELVGDYDLSMGQVVKGIHALPPVAPQQKIG